MKKIIPGVLLVAGTVAGVAYAHHELNFDFTVTPTTAGAVVDAKAYSNGGTYLAASGTTHLPPGALVAHADDRTSPVSPAPVHGDLVGEGRSYGDLWNDGCGNPVTTTFRVTWVDPIGRGAPAGTVAELSMVGTPLPGLTITKRAFVVKSSGDAYHSTAHYDLVIPDMPDEFACSGSSNWFELGTYGYARASGSVTNRVVARNPATPGSYTAWIEYTDTNGGVHKDFDIANID